MFLFSYFIQSKINIDPKKN
uniref:Uncharacterized protein n=1 Tax=Arundo donax TaxID=35708 RepID=A0A0A9AHL3_ARUDO